MAETMVATQAGFDVGDMVNVAGREDGTAGGTVGGDMGVVWMIDENNPGVYFVQIMMPDGSPGDIVPVAESDLTPMEATPAVEDSGDQIPVAPVPDLFDDGHDASRRSGDADVQKRVPLNGPFNGRTPTATCVVCSEPIAKLSDAGEWVDADDNKASGVPEWHEHKPAADAGKSVEADELAVKLLACLELGLVSDSFVKALKADMGEPTDSGEWRDCGEGPWATREEAEAFQHAEVGAHSKIVQNEDGTFSIYVAREKSFELFYSSGGHGGPYQTVDEARAEAERLIVGDSSNNHYSYIDIRERDDSSSGGFGRVVERVEHPDRPQGERLHFPSGTKAVDAQQTPIGPGDQVTISGSFGGGTGTVAEVHGGIVVVQTDAGGRRHLHGAALTVSGKSVDLKAADASESPIVITSHVTLPDGTTGTVTEISGDSLTVQIDGTGEVRTCPASSVSLFGKAFTKANLSIGEMRTIRNVLQSAYKSLESLDWTWIDRDPAESDLEIIGNSISTLSGLMARVQGMLGKSFKDADNTMKPEIEDNSDITDAIKPPDTEPAATGPPQGMVAVFDAGDPLHDRIYWDQSAGRYFDRLANAYIAQEELAAFGLDGKTPPEPKKEEDAVIEGVKSASDSYRYPMIEVTLSSGRKVDVGYEVEQPSGDGRNEPREPGGMVIDSFFDHETGEKAELTAEEVDEAAQLAADEFERRSRDDGL